MALIKYDVRDEQPRYSTKITEYKYSRQAPGSRTQRNVIGIYNLPLPAAIPEDHFSAVTQDFDLIEIGSAIDTIGEGFAGRSVAEQVLATGVAAGVGAGIASAIASAMGKRGGVTDAVERVSGLAVAGAAALPYVGAYGGVTRNPHTALLFKGMQLRTFTLDFRISPRDQGKSREIDALIKRMKVAMHPSYNSTLNLFALDYPSLFKVEFVALPHEGYPKIDFSFITDINVSTSQQGNVMYRDGYPSFINLRLQLKEIDMKTRESFDGSSFDLMRPIEERYQSSGLRGQGDT